MQDKITIRGAREHNLKNIDLELPRNKMIVFTGLSGSGKSSLAFDTIFAEGQRRYIESLSAYARQFLGGMSKPDVDEIEGLSPAISIDQKAHSANPRSTVATITEIYDYLRVLFARVGKPHCPVCGTKIDKMTTDQMQERIMESVDNIRTTKNTKLRNTKKDNDELIILAPVVRGRKGEYYQMLYDVYNSGFLEVRVDGKIKSLKDRIELKKNFKHTIEVVVDRIPNISEESLSKASASALKKKGDNSNGKHTEKGSLAPLEMTTRLAEAVETAVDLSDGLCTVIFPFDSAQGKPHEEIFSTEYSCPKDGFSFPEIEPRLFSFNSPYGYCDYCTGLGTKSLFSEEDCPKCEGKRLNENALAVKVGGKNIWEITNLTIADARDFFNKILDTMSEKDLEISSAVLKEISNRLQFMFEVGLHYLTLNRKAGTMSGGEAQRIRLASQVGTKLVGALYVLDEPTIGLHQKDNDRLVSTLRNLCDVGNTIIVVEHDEDTILTSDWVVDIGPGAGVHGGEITYSGNLSNLLESKETRNKKYPQGISLRGQTNSKSQITKVDNFGCRVAGDASKSLTGQYLRGEKKIDVPDKRRKVDNHTAKIKIKGASEHNLKNIDVDIPLRRFVCLTGVSGSGKSTLMHNILYRTVANRINYHGHAPEDKKKKAGTHKQILNTEYIDKIIRIDQNPIGRSPRSNPATYTGTWTHIRDLFAATPEARMRGYKNGRFSFNRPGGRCDNCEGRGTLEIEMHFLPSVEIVCDVCKGKRFNNETLQIHYNKKNISDVLDMTIEEAEEFFRDIPFIYDKLKVLNEVGLEYLTLGQSAKTLSGGEAQRTKLSKELAKRNTTKTLYLLDEPTTGLHYDDVKKLIKVLQELVSKGNTILVIEHNLDVIKCADWIIDLGPEGGDKGGEVVCTGTPEEVARKSSMSYTGKYLKKVLQ